MTRTFEDKTATREQTPLLIGLIGASGSGKTYSALRLATGFQCVVGGDIGFIDTEARRALHYADEFKFRHLDFRAPFGPLDYLAAVEHFSKKGVKTIIIDSMSHEHEGPGGVLEQHETETVRLMEQWRTSADKVKMSAWQKPKTERRRLINSILQLPINFVFCFRAKEKMDLSGPKPKVLGWMPVAGEEFVYEQTVNCLLYPNSGGVPSWQPEEMGEKAIVKLPRKLESCFTKGSPITEATGEALARWAAGGLPGDAPAPRAGQADVSATPPNGQTLWNRLTKELKMPPKEAKAWVDRYFTVPEGTKMTTEQAEAGMELSGVLLRYPGDDDKFAAMYEALAAKGAVL